ncbi:multidrug ABC transporter permease/ATP-binding protein [Staphylococcus felis]|uniref:ABC transporter ATP-binding protein n=1 Tax=Staphylococcus felis TaxID=46127 RepID=UPI000E28831A|nr:ABC transporter transmembrane domain-containing protein [Staphylococcus felis]REH96305.1 multidrug ABC transporter permease/ATP-binding protein [Staphylococcus felis]REI03772.1 multidrug ABC transporter permease/ATP-binding protein [Staphylococcus felis]REI22263.1 multidrug ABC transporter permease/ATP-binding protein [Staphylococcus felis]REI33437.1 multidrug ABC transporter permease/ATP-binding protein [Staphylococcus felis]
MRVFKDLSWFFKQEKKRFMISFIALLITAFCNLVPPQIMGFVIDHMTQKTLTPQNLTGYLLVILCAGLIVYALRYYSRLKLFGASAKLGRILRNRLYIKYTSMSPSFFQKYRTGDLMAHATNDIRAVQSTAGIGVLTLSDAVITGGMTLVMMAITISWQLTIIAMIPLPFLVILTSYYGQLLHKGFKEAQESFSQLNDKTQESVAGVKVIKSFGYEASDEADFTALSDRVVAKNLKVSKIDALFDPTIQAIIGISYLLSVIFGAIMVTNQNITIGQLITFTTYLGMLVWPLLALGFFFNIVQRGAASYDRIRDIENETNDIQLIPQTDEIPTGDIDIDIRYFKFTDETAPRLQDIVFSIQSGMTVGIVGPTGSGKSLLLRLLLREFDTNRSEDIRYGGRSIRDYDIEKLRGQLGYVPQEHFLFSSTIRGNIAFSEPTISDEALYQASTVSHIHQDIMSLPNGYDTIVGERGVSLSGGQKQRISIARALVTQPEVLILDDSLSAVDAETEAAILQHLKQERHGQTNIITAHRMSAVMHADLIIVMRDGTVIERGTHDELMQEDGWYHETFNAQAMQSRLTHDLEDEVGGEDNEVKRK